MSRWFRHYAGMMRDEKLVKVAVKSKQTVERVVWIWGAILESAAEINDGGRYEFDAGEAAYFLRCNEDDILCVVECLESIGRLHAGVVARWSDRQFDSDSSKERQRRYRERLKAGADIQQRNGDVGKTSRDGQVTAQDTETDTDPSEDARAPEVDVPFEKFWEAYPNKTGKPSAERAFSQAIKRASPDEIMAGVRAYAAKTDDRQWCSPVKWLSDDRWKDQPAKPPDKPPPKPNGLAHLQKPQSRAEYLAQELERSERSFRR